MSDKGMQELITWTLAKSQLPDDELLVMINIPQHDEPVWFGYYDSIRWYLVDGTALADDVVIAWADLPCGISDMVKGESL